MQIFVAVCQEGSVTKAAEKLFLAQPAVSLAVKELEKECGQPLFERFARKLHITPFGKEIYDYSQRILSIYTEMESAVTELDFTNTLRVGTGTFLGKMIFPQYVRRFQDENPGASVRLFIDRTENNASSLLENKVDFVIMETFPNLPNVCIKVLQTAPIVALCNIRHPLARQEHVTPQDIVRYPLLLRESTSHIHNDVKHYFFEHGILIHPYWESISVSALLNAVRENLGVAFLSTSNLREVDLQEIKIIPLPDLHAQRLVSLYYHKDKKITPLMRRFIDGFEQFLREETLVDF